MTPSEAGKMLQRPIAPPTGRTEQLAWLLQTGWFFIGMAFSSVVDGFPALSDVKLAAFVLLGLGLIALSIYGKLTIDRTRTETYFFELKAWQESKPERPK